MEKLRVPFVRPGESNAVNRALLESLGLLPPSVSQSKPLGRVAKPRHILALGLSALMKPFRDWLGRKGGIFGRRST